VCNKIKTHLFALILLQHLFYFVAHETRPAIKIKKYMLQIALYRGLILIQFYCRSGFMACSCGLLRPIIKSHAEERVGMALG